MNFQYGLVITMSLLVSGSLALIYNQPDQIPKWQTLQYIEVQNFYGDYCDEPCREQHVERGFSCTEITPGDYVCRPPREIRFPEREYQIPAAFPPNYGEFAYFPDGLNLTQSRLFDVAQVDLINPDTKQIKIDFASHHLDWPETYFEYSATMYPGDTFVSHCTGSHLKTGHLVEYVDVFELDGTTYIEFWGPHIVMPDNLLPCEMPDLIEHSLEMDLSLGIEFDMPEPSIHQCQKIIMNQYELYRQDRQNSFSLSGDDLDSWNIFITQRIEQLAKEFDESCKENAEQWITDEYDSKIKELNRAKFLEKK